MFPRPAHERKVKKNVILMISRRTEQHNGSAFYRKKIFVFRRQLPAHSFIIWDILIKVKQAPPMFIYVFMCDVWIKRTKAIHNSDFLHNEFVNFSSLIYVNKIPSHLVPEWAPFLSFRAALPWNLHSRSPPQLCIVISAARSNNVTAESEKELEAALI